MSRIVEVNTTCNPYYLEIEDSLAVIWTSSKSWSTVYAQFSAGGGSGVIYVVVNPANPSFVFQIPAGSYDLTRAIFVGLGGVPIVDIAAGGTIDAGGRLNLWLDSVLMKVHAAICAVGSVPFVRLVDFAIFQRIADAPAFPAASASANAFLFNGARFISPVGATTGLFDMSAGKSLTIESFGGSQQFVPNALIGGAAGSAYFAVGDGATVSNLYAPGVVLAPTSASAFPPQSKGGGFVLTSKQVGNYSAVIWESVLCDTSGGTFTVTAPSPNAYAEFRVSNQYFGAVNMTVLLPLLGGGAAFTVVGGTTSTFAFVPSEGKWMNF